MRNISQIILNIDVMKELKNLEAIRELLASHPIYTYDYSDGLLINKEDTNIRQHIMLSKNGNPTKEKPHSLIPWLHQN